MRQSRQKSAKRTKSKFYVLANFIEKYCICLIVIVVVVSIVIPVILGGVKLCGSSMTIDGLLSYCGTVLGEIVTLLVALLAIYQAKKVFEMETSRADEEHKQEIRPRLQLMFKPCGENTYLIEISNIGAHVAKDVYLYELPLFRLIKAQCRLNKYLEFSGNTKDERYIGNFFEKEELDADGFPKTINLVYVDVDENIWSQNFENRMDGSGNKVYEAHEPEIVS